MEKLCQEKGFFLSDLVLLTILLSTEECVHEGGGGIDDADLAGRATASPFTMVTRRNLYAMRTGGLVVFYPEGLESFACGNSLGERSGGGNCLFSRALQFFAWQKQDDFSLSRCKVLSVLK